MSVPQSTSKKDPVRAAKAKALRLAKEEAEAAARDQHSPQPSAARPPPSSSSVSAHPPSPASSYGGHSTASAYSGTQAHQSYQGGHLNVPNGGGGYNPQRPLSPQSVHSTAPSSLSHHAPVRPQAGPSGGRPLSGSGPPRSALMQAPVMSHSVSTGNLPLSAAYNVDPPVPASTPRPQVHPVPSMAQQAPLPPLPTTRPPVHPQDAYHPAPVLAPATSPYPEHDSRRTSWAPTSSPHESTSHQSSAYSSSAYGGPSISSFGVVQGGNALAGPSSGGGGQRGGADQSVSSAKRSAESLIGYVRNVRQVLFRRSATDQHLIRTMDIFASNLMGHTQRLIAREMELTGGQENRALASIARDFDKAAGWMQEHQQDIAINWPPDRSIKALKEMDDRLTKAFTSKLAVALFESVQETRQISLQISRQLDGLDGLVSDLPNVLRRIMSGANSAEIDATISRLRIEEDALKPGNGVQSGYGGGEAEKTIQSLLDAMEAMRLSQAEKEARTAAEQRLLNHNGYPAPTPSSHQSHPTTSYRPLDSDQASVRSVGTDLSYATQGGGGSTYHPTTPSANALGKAVERWPDEKQDPLEAGGIYFQPVDPISKLELVDPVLADDGCIHDRFSVVNHKPENPLFPGRPLRVLGDVIQLRKAIFARFPERKDECFERRAAYLASAIDEYDSGFSFLDIVDVMDRLSAILSWQSGEEDTGVLVRRGILRWRLRNLAGAKNDLLRALELSPTLPIHHLLALVHFELRHFDEAMTSVEQALARDGRDSIACAIRSQIHSFYGRISAATRDAEAASHSVNSEGTDDQSSRVTKTTYSPHPNRTFPDSPLPEFPDLPNLLAGFAWLTLGEPIRASNHVAQSVDRGVLGDPWPRCLWGYILSVSSEESVARTEGLRELEASWKLSGDVWKADDDDGGLTLDARPLQASIGILLAQAKAQVDKKEAKEILMQSLQAQHPLLQKTSEELGFLAKLHAETGDYESASIAFDEAIHLASKSRRPEERAALLAERTRQGAL